MIIRMGRLIDFLEGSLALESWALDSAGTGVAGRCLHLTDRHLEWTCSLVLDKSST